MPNTETGQRLRDYAYSSKPSAIYLAALSEKDIRDIETEAAALERERLLALVGDDPRPQWVSLRDGRQVTLRQLLAEPDVS